VAGKLGGKMTWNLGGKNGREIGLEKVERENLSRNITREHLSGKKWSQNWAARFWTQHICCKFTSN
jgi:hypothetical protein